jgi:lipid-A-disaccharide synthase-like uncharacterized protein
MNTIIPIVLMLFIVVELLYLVSCAITIQRVIKYRKTTNENRTVSLFTIIFLASCIFGSIIHSVQIKLVEKFAVPAFIVFVVIELFYLFIITQKALHNAKIKGVLSILLLSSLLFIPFIVKKQGGGVSFDPLFAYESLIATSISFAYFLQLGNEIKIKNVLEDPITLIMLGLFFCYSLPFAYNTAMAAVNIIDNDFYSNIKKSKYDVVLLGFVSRVGTICYIILNIFISKAFKCRTQAPVGISS